MPSNIINPVIVANDGHSGPAPATNNFRQEGTDAGSEAFGIGIPNEESRTSSSGPPGREPFSPGAGIDNFHPVGVEASDVAPGLGVPAEDPSFKSVPASVANPNQTFAGEVAPGVGVAADHNQDDSNDFSQDGPVKVLSNTEASLGQTFGGLYMPGGNPVNTTENNVAGQVLGVGFPQNVKGGIT
jgi:hypothetical protein